MEIEQLKVYQQLLNNVYSQEIQKNEESIKKWTQEKNKHEKIIEGLQTIVNELSINCVVPLGKRALMKGKLSHTNEILICIGDGYFVKYSAQQAIELCNRRIKSFDEQLKKLEQERNLFESRQMLPLHYGAFASEDCKDVIEYMNDEELGEWKLKHREREKEYRQKLAKLENLEKKEIETEDDLFQRLDQLELEEEIADEFNRLEDEHRTLFAQDLEDYEVSDETDEEIVKSDNEIESKTVPNEQIKNHEESILSNNVINTADNNKVNYSNVQSDQPNEASLMEKVDNIEKENTEIQKTNERVKTSITKDTRINGKFEVSIIKEDEIERVLEKSHFNVGAYKPAPSDKKINKCPNVSFNDSPYSESSAECEKLKSSERRVSFAEPHFVEVNYSAYHNDDSKQNIFNQISSTTNFSTCEDDDIIKIDFHHSETQSFVDESSYNSIMSPRDIYKIYCKPKSILKKSLNNLNHEKSIRVLDNCIKEEEDAENDDDNDVVKTKSAYREVVQDVQERKKAKISTDNKETTHTKKAISRFRLERANIKK